MTARPTKCLLGASRMEFLDQVRGDVITPSCDNLEKVRNTNKPEYQEASEIFLVSCRLIQGHIPAFAEISAPLSSG